VPPYAIVLKRVIASSSGFPVNFPCPTMSQPPGSRARLMARTPAVAAACGTKGAGSHASL